MAGRAERQGRRIGDCIWLSAIALVLVLSPSIPVFAEPGTATDPDDVSLRLDLKTVSHTDDASSITYTVETYENFPDDWTDFRFAIDKNRDGKVDNFVSVQWEDDAIVAGVEDVHENRVARATVSRPAPNALRVSFPVSALGGVATYAYQASATTDLNGNGEREPGEEDFAPDTGWYEHRLGPGSAPATASSTVPTTPAGRSSTTAAPPAPPPAPASPPTAAPTPPPAARTPAAATAGKSRQSPAAPAAPRPAAPPAVAAPPAASQPAAMARTGPEHVWLGRLGAGLLILAVPCRSLARKRG